MEEKDKAYYRSCELFINHQMYEQYIKSIVDRIKNEGKLFYGEFIGIGSIDLIKEKWQEGHLPIIMDNNGHIYVKFLPFELFCARMTPEEFIKANKEYSNELFKETNKNLINTLQEKIDNNDPNVDIEKAKETIGNLIENLKKLKYDD